jgi:hypothetical protein
MIRFVADWNALLEGALQAKGVKFKAICSDNVGENIKFEKTYLV